MFNVATSWPEEVDGADLHVINGWTICHEGLRSSWHPRRRVPDNHIEIAKGFLNRCRRVKVPDPALTSSFLKHVIEKWAGQYIVTGAVIIAAFDLGIVALPLRETGRDAAIGVNIRDVGRLGT